MEKITKINRVGFFSPPFPPACFWSVCVPAFFSFLLSWRAPDPSKSNTAAALARQGLILRRWRVRPRRTARLARLAAGGTRTRSTGRQIAPSFPTPPFVLARHLLFMLGRGKRSGWKRENRRLPSRRTLRSFPRARRYIAGLPRKDEGRPSSKPETEPKRRRPPEPRQESGAENKLERRTLRKGIFSSVNPCRSLSKAAANLSARGFSEAAGFAQR